MNTTLLLISLSVSAQLIDAPRVEHFDDDDVESVGQEQDFDAKYARASEWWKGANEDGLAAAPERFGLTALDALEPYDVVLRGDVTFTRYQQFHAGIAVDGWLVIQSNAGIVHRVRHRLVSEIVSLTAARIDEREARQRGESALTPRRAAVDDLVQHVTRDGRVVWRGVVMAGGQGQAVEVDAVTGGVEVRPTALRLWNKATVNGRYPIFNGNQEVRLNVESERAGFVTTLRLRSPAAVSNNVTVYVNGGDYSTESNWNDVTTTLTTFNDVLRQGVWVTVHAAVQKTRLLMSKGYGIQSPERFRAVGVSGGGLEYEPLSGGWILVPYTRDSHGNVTAPDVTYDAIAHETGHVLLDRIWDFPGYLSIDEDRALAESFADIIAVASEEYAEGDFNWLLGEDRMPPTRSMNQPSSLPNDDNTPGSEEIGDAAWNLA